MESLTTQQQLKNMRVVHNCEIFEFDRSTYNLMVYSRSSPRWNKIVDPLSQVRGIEKFG
jgi:hypothetical protein